MQSRLVSSTHPLDEALCLKELWGMYAKILHGNQAGDLDGPDCLVRFNLPGISEPLLVQIRIGFERKSPAKFFQATLRASKERGEKFVFLCVGEPPHQDPFRTLITSFEVYGGWAGPEIERRMELLNAIKTARGLFPLETLPKFYASPKLYVVGQPVGVLSQATV